MVKPLTYGRMGKIAIPIDYVPENSYLTFVKKTTEQSGWGKNETRVYAKAIYRCICGAEKELNIGNVKRGAVISCGCFQKESQSIRQTTHGLSKSPLYKIWMGMINRCENEKKDNYRFYGGRGVTVCDEWRHDFKAFYDWAISMGWKKGMQIDKDEIPKQLHIPALLYSPAMCSILSGKENSNSRISNHPITFNGKTQNMTQWEAELGFGKDVIYNRLKRGWSEERALTTPLLK